MQAAQILLIHLGYDPGAADGKAGPKTVEAVRAFKADHGLYVTPTVDDLLMLQLAKAVAETPGS